jgi:hypothetical protein
MINTKKDSKKNKEDMGWYSKEDMSKVLHWNPILDALSGLWVEYSTV